MTRSQTTQRDIAEKLQVSVSLVGKVLSGNTNVWVSEEKRQQIYRAAEDMNYQLNAAARALRSGKTNTLAIMTTIPSFSTDGRLEAMASKLAQAGYELLIECYSGPSDALAKLRQMTAAHRVDAFLLWGDETDVEPQGELLDSLGMPFVAKGYYEERHPTWPQIDFDHVRMTGEIVQRFFDQGHRRIAYLAFNHASLIYLQRLRLGYLSAMKRLTGSEPPEEMMATVPDGIEQATHQTARWFDLPEDRRPTAIVVGAGNAAWLAIEMELARRGLLIGETPGCIAVAGETHHRHTLLFGSALGYCDVELADLGVSMVTHLVLPLMKGELENRTVRIAPRLQALESLDLRNRLGIQIVGQPGLSGVQTA
jgi:LacI family transcriptional regulator